MQELAFNFSRQIGAVFALILGYPAQVLLLIIFIGVGLGQGWEQAIGTTFALIFIAFLVRWKMRKVWHKIRSAMKVWRTILFARHQLSRSFLELRLDQQNGFQKGVPKIKKIEVK